jgi:hypothetical protein
VATAPDGIVVIDGDDEVERFRDDGLSCVLRPGVPARQSASPFDECIFVALIDDHAGVGIAAEGLVDLPCRLRGRGDCLVCGREPFLRRVLLVECDDPLHCCPPFAHIIPRATTVARG